MAGTPRTSSRTPRVALLVETSLASGRDILRGIARYVRERGPWSLFHAPRGLEESAPTWLSRWKGDGIIARVTSPNLAALLKKTGLPVVDVLGMVPGPAFPLVHVDDVAIARLAFEHLHDRGFRQFAFCGLAGEQWAGRGNDWSERRCDAFAAHARKFGCELKHLEFTRSDLESTPWEKRQDRLAAWLRDLPKPVGLMVCSDQRGLDVLDACHRVNVHVPDQVAIVGVDNDEPLCEVCDPPLSSVWPDHFGVGYQAAALLHQLILGSDPPSEARLVPPHRVVTRQSSDVLAVEDPAVASALRYIRERACEGVSIDEIARVAGVSRSMLQRRFRVALGQTIHDQIVTIRIKRAVELITTTDLPLVEIAERCGFNHQEYMGVVFRERLDQTPAQFRHASESHSAAGTPIARRRT